MWKYTYIYKSSQCWTKKILVIYLIKDIDKAIAMLFSI